MNQETDGKTELQHEPDPGYTRIFYVVFFITVLYLAIVLGATF
jgi:hypothetical protein